MSMVVHGRRGSLEESRRRRRKIASYPRRHVYFTLIAALELSCSTVILILIGSAVQADSKRYVI